MTATALTEAERIAAARWKVLPPTPGEVLRDGWLCWQLAGLLWVAGAAAFWWAGLAFWQQAVEKGAHR